MVKGIGLRDYIKVSNPLPYLCCSYGLGYRAYVSIALPAFPDPWQDFLKSVRQPLTDVQGWPRNALILPFYELFKLQILDLAISHFTKSLLKKLSVAGGVWETT